MVTIGTSSKLVDPRDLLEVLRQHPLTSPFNLALYSEQHGRKELTEAIHEVCSAHDGELSCTSECYQRWEDSSSKALLTNQPVTYSCPQGFLCFSIPLPTGKGLPDCLMGGGVFERDVASPKTSARKTSPIAPESADKKVLSANFVSLAEAKAVSEEIFKALPRLLEQQVHALSLLRTTQKLEAVQKLARDLARCDEREQAVDIVSEALVVLFNLPRVLIALRGAGKIMTIHSTLGLAPESCKLDQNRLNDYFSRSDGLPEVLTETMVPKIFPGLEACSAHIFPLGEGDENCGAITILDVNLHSRDQALVEILVNCLATRLKSLATAEGHRQEKQFSARLVSMISELSQVESRQALYEQILEMSAELLSASSGSLMLLNESDGTLGISAAKGMTASLAKAMTVPYGEGISGRVAKSGFPMLVNDIERDKRISSRNRPRFKTKSFVSLPLETEGRLVGVLNLADKSDGTHFSETDLTLVQNFTSHAVLMIDRAATLEKAGQFEQLAITDPLTGLYNRRLLEDRLQEELSRSERQRHNFCLILADLDNFKAYNDLCGHLAGDKALCKAGELIRINAREMDIVTRYGGEEFCLILPGTGKKESLLVGERIKRAIESEGFPGENHLPLGRLTASLGVASFPEDGVTANELIHAADLALYRAKSLGKNRLVLFEPSLEQSALQSKPD